MAPVIKVSKYRVKLFYNFFFLFIAFAILISLFQLQRERQYRVEQLENNLATYIELVQKFIVQKNIISTHDFKQIDSLAHIIPNEARITIVNENGEVLYDSSVPDYSKLENHLNRPEILKAMNENTGSSIRHSSSTHKDYFYHALKIDKYYIRAAMPYNPQTKDFLRVDSFYIYFTLMLFLLALLSLIYITDKVGKSISQLQKFASQAADGEVLQVTEDFPKNELGTIGRQIVTVYKRLEKTRNDLAAEREKLYRHLQISHEGIAIFNSEKKPIIANNHFIQYLNTITDEPSITPGSIFTIAECQPITSFIFEQLDKNMQSGMASNILTLNKSGKYYMIQAIVFQDLSFEISINDVTKVEKEKKLKQQMTSNIAHELKTPVSSILGYLETLNDSKVDDEKRQFFIERSLVQCQRLASLIQDISLLNKIEEAADLFEIEPINVADTVKLVIDDLRYKIDEQNIGICIDIKPKVAINGNRPVFYSIWRNLIENSVNYAGKNSKIKITNYLEDDFFYYFSFSDNGTGIPEQHLTRIFERFYRIDSGRSRNMGGTGLGLSIVKNGVQFHKGEISVKNIKGGGLEFVFTISKSV